MASSTLKNWLLGTAQFGMPYGVTNVTGQTLPNEAWQMIDLACALGGALGIDTAAGYGQAEEVLSLRPFNGYVTTKISAACEVSMRDQLRSSLTRMQLPNVDSLLIHDSENLTCGAEIASVKNQLNDLKREGLAVAVGISVYDVEQIRHILPVWVPDVIQVPLNPLNQAFSTSGEMERLKALGVKIQARSLFLQGVLLNEALPQRLSSLSNVHAQWSNFLANADVSAMSACKTFALTETLVDHWVLGFENIKQLNEFINAPEVDVTFADCALCDVDRVDPRKW